MRRKLTLVLLLVATAAHADFREFLRISVDPSIQAKLRRAAEASLKQFPNLKADDLAITLVDLTQPILARGDYHGDAPFYPASVIKIFFMSDIFLRKKFDVPDVPRAMREMIGVSDNDATAYILDILAGTEPGPDLQGKDLQRFIEKRRSINQDFARLGYDISAMCKPWSFGPYGRDLQVLGPNRENRNRLTSNATASLITWIARRHAPDSEVMLDFLFRPLNPTRPEEDQVKEFIGEALPAGAKEWSKAGWTSEVRHDVAYLEFPDKRKIVLAIYTRGQAADTKMIPAIARNVFAEFGIAAAPPAPATAASGR
ncbi:MAG TPA: serine hydrolase [Thermoanaerobaculia bacterium]